MLAGLAAYLEEEHIRQMGKWYFGALRFIICERKYNL